MREILFRGKRTDTGEWVQGNFISAENYCCILQPEEKVHPLDYPYLDGNLGTIDGSATPVIPETIGQFTGLIDKHGKKIFEGDILNMHGGCDVMDISEYDIRVKVVYGRKGYGAEIGFTGAYNSGAQTPLMLEGALTVIGNIHDNKLEE